MTDQVRQVVSLVPTLHYQGEKTMHTPTPWKIEYGYPTHEIRCDAADIAVKNCRVCNHLSKQDAALIVKAVNSYEAMREALKSAQNDINFHGGKLSGGTIDAIKKALTLAEGKE